MVAKGILSGSEGVLSFYKMSFTDIHDVRKIFCGDVMKRL